MERTAEAFCTLRRSARLASREERLKTDFGSNADFHMSPTRRIIDDNQISSFFEIDFEIKTSVKKSRRFDISEVIFK